MAKGDLAREIGKWVLVTIGVSGLVILAATSPGFGYVLKEIQKRRFKNYRPYRINQALKRLENQELISIREQAGKIRIELSERGKKKVLEYELKKMRLKQGRWDGIWRVVIFDIPEDKKSARDFLRLKMKELGFYSLQKSVLVTPWPCRDEIDFIKHFYVIRNCVNLIEAKSFDGDDQVRRYFKL